MDPLTSFVAIDRRHALVSGHNLPDSVEGSLLFADVSGSTPLAAALTQALGPQRGTEELTHHVNRVLTPLIAQVHSYGGAVITFPGDAITCWFDGDKGRRATACGLAMQEQMRWVGTVAIPGGRPVSIAVKIAVVAGSARRFAVGDPGIQILDVLAGRLLDRMAGVDALLEAGEVGIGTEVLAWLGPEADIGMWRAAPSGEHFAIVTRLTSDIARCPWEGDPDLDRQVADPWVPAVVAERLGRGEEALIAELRLAVPVFLGFSGLDYDGDYDAGEKLDAYVNWVQTVLAHYGGHLLEITMGDKGSTLGMTFGAPVGYEDDASRAVTAAIALRSPPPSMPFIETTQIGITQGQLYTGACGSETRRTYIMLGNEANFAARLKSRAVPGQILVSERVALAAPGFDFEELEPVALKGLSEPMAVSAVRGGPPGRSWRTVPWRRLPDMVGREEELALLTARLGALQEGKSGCIIVGGEAAIGKSRLVEEVQARAQDAGVLTLMGFGDAIEHSIPYHGWRPVFHALFGLEDGDERAGGDLESHVLAQLESDTYLTERAPLLNAILPTHLEDNELTAQMTGEVRAANTREALVRVLQRAQRRGGFRLLLILEDAHLLDSASWALAVAVRHSVEPAIELIVMRPLTDPVPAEFESLRDDPETLHIDLGPLPEDDIRLLVSRALDASELDPQVFHLINDRAEGNPFFSQELAHGLMESGLIAVDEDRVCRLAADSAVDAARAFPDTIQAVITSRFDRLPAELQSLLKVASVIGRDFGYSLLHDIYPVEKERFELRARLRELERRDMVLRQSLDADAAYMFKHIITQEVVYGLMLFAQRRDLHRAIAHWYERTHADDLTPFYGLLAHHWERAGEPQMTVGYMGLAGEQAVASFANREGVSFLNRALALADSAAAMVEGSRVARWRLQLGEAHVGLSEYREGIAQLERGLVLLDQRVPRSTVLQALGILGQAARQLAHRAAPAWSVGRAADPGLMRRISRAYERLTEAAYVAEDMLLALYSSLAALNSAESGGNSPELARAYVTTGAMLGFFSLNRAAERYIARAFETVAHTKNVGTESHVAQVAGTYYMGVGNWRRTEELFGRARELSQRLGDAKGREGAVGNLAIAAHLQGRFDGGVELAGEVLASAGARGDVLFQAIALAVGASCLCQLGKCIEASGQIDEFRAMVRDHPDVSSTSVQLLLHDVQLGLYLRQGNRVGLLDEVNKMLGLLGEAPMFDPGNFSGYSNLAEACLALWRAEPGDAELRRLCNRACRLLRRYARALPIGLPRSEVWSGEYAWLRGRRTKARSLWRDALVHAQELKMAYDEGLAHFALGRSFEPDHAERARHLASAVEIYTRLGAAGALADVEAELGSGPR